jgi:hypothetical protein
MIIVDNAPIVKSIKVTDLNKGDLFKVGNNVYLKLEKNVMHLTSFETLKYEAFAGFTIQRVKGTLTIENL